MKCPYCGNAEQKVLESRPARDGEAIRRRRECLHCVRRFTTFESLEKPRLLIVKRDGKREEFDREKVLSGMVTACRKRPVSLEDLRTAAETIEREMFDQYEAEVDSSKVGERVMEALRRIDGVAYVRFASVYREFEDPMQFMEIVNRVTSNGKNRGKEARASKN